MIIEYGNLPWSSYNVQEIHNNFYTLLKYPFSLELDIKEEKIKLLITDDECVCEHKLMEFYG
jgi:hypothetical protein